MSTPILGRVREEMRSPVVRDSAVLLVATAMMAAAGAGFWVIAARLQPQENVGLAASLVAAIVALSILSQMGLNITLVKTLPSSVQPAGDVVFSLTVVAAAGLLLGSGAGLVLPRLSPELVGVLPDGRHALVLGLLVSGTAVNVLTDSVFLSRRRLVTNLWINGVTMGLLKCGLPFVLVSLGARGLALAVGGASLLAGVVSTTIVLRDLGRPNRFGPSPQLRAAVRFSVAGYATSVLDLGALLLLPIVVLNTVGARQGALYFVSFQIATLLNSAVYVIGSSTFAEASRHVGRREEVVRRSVLVTTVVVGSGALAVIVVAPRLLGVFGDEYAAGAPVLRVFAIGSLAVAVNYAAIIRLRLEHYLLGMMVVPLVTTAMVLGLAAELGQRGAPWIAAAWGVGQLGGGLVGMVLVGTRTRSRVRVA